MTTTSRSALLAALLLSAPLARAAPVTLAHSGYVLDANDDPLEGPTAFSFALHGAATGGSALWTGSCTPTVYAGSYAVNLGGDCGPTLDSSLLAPGAALWLEVTVGTITLAPRSALGPAPSAVVATESLDTQVLAGALSATGGTLNDTNNPVDWTRLKNVPAVVVNGRGYTAGDGLTLTGSQLAIANDGSALARASGNSITLVGGAPALAGATLTGATQAAGLTSSGDVSVTGTAKFVGDGAGLTNVPAGALSGTLTTGQLPATIPFSQLSGDLALPSAASAPASPAAGQIFFDSALQLTRVFDGTSWRALHAGTTLLGTSATPASSCLAARNAGITYDAVLWIDPDGPNGVAAFQMYCDMTTTRAGQLGWGLLAVVNNDNGGFWTTSLDLRTGTKGTPHPLAENYFLSLERWRALLAGGTRTVLNQIFRSAGDYNLVYPGFELDASFNYRHSSTTHQWQHNDMRNGAWTGNLYPTKTSNSTCGDAGAGWYYACGYSQFYSTNGAIHGIDSAGNYNNPPISGVTRKYFWVR